VRPLTWSLVWLWETLEDLTIKGRYLGYNETSEGGKDRPKLLALVIPASIEGLGCFLPEKMGT